MIEAFGPDIWIVAGETVAVAGFRYPMAIIRLPGGDLILWSPIALSDELRGEVDALGAVRYLAPPNSLHHIFLGEWRRAYPEAEVFAPPGLREKRKDIRFAGDFADGPIAAWAGEIDLAVIGGNVITTEVVFFHRRSRTTIFADLLQHFPPQWFEGWRAVVAKLDLMVNDAPSVPRKFRIAFTNRRAAHSALQSILEWPTQKVIMAHGRPVIEDGQAFLRDAFAWLIER